MHVVCKIHIYNVVHVGMNVHAMEVPPWKFWQRAIVAIYVCKVAIANDKHVCFMASRFMDSRTVSTPYMPWYSIYGFVNWLNCTMVVVDFGYPFRLTAGGVRVLRSSLVCNHIFKLRYLFHATCHPRALVVLAKNGTVAYRNKFEVQVHPMEQETDTDTDMEMGTETEKW